MTPIKITHNGILKLLLNLDPNKAVGPDQVPIKFLKLCAYEIADIYVILFQASLDQGIVPHDWKQANIVPLFKKGDKSLPENYRPISLTSLSCKILEHVVHRSDMTHLERHRVLDNKLSIKTKFVKNNTFSRLLWLEHWNYLKLLTSKRATIYIRGKSKIFLTTFSSVTD